MKKHSRKHRAGGGDLSPISFAQRVAGPRFENLYRSHGGDVSAKELALGKAGGVRSKGSRTPAHCLSLGYAEGKRSGKGAKSIAMGHAAGRRKFATGGHATDMEFEAKGERLRKTRARNDTLGRPHYSFGGELVKGINAIDQHFEKKRQMKNQRMQGIQSHARKQINPSKPLAFSKGGKVDQGMRALYHALHSHFENEPQMKKLRVTKAQLDEGEPHRFAKGGHMWMQNATNPATKGALHKALHVPMGKKIPMSKIEKAEHSKSPLLRKRAHLAETFRRYKPQ